MTNDDPNTDPGYCGLAPLETGKWDPFWQIACKRHDRAFDKLKAGNPDKTGLQVTGEFMGDVIAGAAEGLYAVVTAPIYLLVGGLGGLVRWNSISMKKKE